MIDTHIAAYLAGFFDGEGHITCYKTKGPHCYPRIVIGATNTVEAPIDLCKRAFGGTVTGSQRKELNTVGKPYKKQYNWRCGGVSDAIMALTSMLPWLTVKREKAELALIVLLGREGSIWGKTVVIPEAVEEVFNKFGSRIYIEPPGYRKKTPRVCEFCKLEFLGKSEATRFCSRSCRMRNQNARIKEAKLAAQA